MVDSIETFFSTLLATVENQLDTSSWPEI